LRRVVSPPIHASKSAAGNLSNALVPGLVWAGRRTPFVCVELGVGNGAMLDTPFKPVRMKVRKKPVL
jgi:hypothetical protein